jgi:hypothetical protein
MDGSHLHSPGAIRRIAGGPAARADYPDVQTLRDGTNRANTKAQSGRTPTYGRVLCQLILKACAKRPDVQKRAGNSIRQCLALSVCGR